MVINNLSLKNFKNLDLNIDFSSGLNLVIAPNGAGKTNLLEALYIISNGSSFRNFPELTLIQYKSTDFAKISTIVDKNNLEIILIPENGIAKKKLKVNGSPQSVSQFMQYCFTIFFSPTSINIVGGGPSIRRKDLDQYLSNSDKSIRNTIFEYKKVIRNRNFVLFRLKQGNGSLDEIDFWNNKLINLGSEIIFARIDVLNKIQNDISKFSKDIFHFKNNGLRIEYGSNIKYDYDIEKIKNALKEKIVNNLDSEIEYASSVTGPHRDDILFTINGRPLRQWGSRGQQRLASLIYKLALWKLFSDKNEVAPVLLLDDVMSELDQEHRINLEAFLQRIESQVFITSSKKEDFTKKLRNNAKIINL